MHHTSLIDHIGIVGGGELGQALGRAFYRKNITVQFYDKQDDRSTVATLEELVRHNEVLLMCVPSWANRSVAKEIARHASSRQHAVVTFSKGVEDGFVTLDKALGEHLDGICTYGLAFGPTVAEELAVGRLAAAVLALSDMSWYDRLSKLFAKARIYTEPSSDLQGLALCGVLKNIYAIAFGMSDGLHLGANVKGRLAVMVLREMKQLLIHLETEPQLAEGLAGLGDLITTGITEASFNYRIGKTIAEGIADEGIKSEGLNTLMQLGQKVDTAPYPLLNTLNRIIYHYEPISTLETMLLGEDKD
jgi:glycerol-3-phosphate dehydrogenase (NAD(P)+)